MNDDLQTIKQINQSLELPNNVIQKIICKQLLNDNQGQTNNLILTHFRSKFYLNEDLKIIYGIINNFWTKYNKAPSKELLYKLCQNDKFKDKKDKLIKELDQVLSIDLSKYDRKFVQDSILNYIKAKSIYITILDNIDYIQTYNDVSKIMPKLEDTMKISIEEDIGIEYFNNIKNHIKELTSTTNKIPFLWKEWDKVTFGGIPINQPCMFVIMAQPGLGKSQFMMNIGYNYLLQDKKVLMISLQMSQRMYSSRMSSLFSDICVNELKNHTDILAKKIQVFKLNHPNSGLYIKQYSPNEFNSNKLKITLEKLKKNKNFIPDLIIVDYLNIMSTNSSSSHMKSYQKIGTISKELRSISIETKIPILTGTQANRSSSGGGYATEEISMSNTSDSAGINMDADCLFALYQMQGQREQNRMNVKILKNRLGGFVNQSFPMYVDYNTLKISDFNTIQDDDNLSLDTKEKIQKQQDEQEVNAVFEGL